MRQEAVSDSLRITKNKNQGSSAGHYHLALMMKSLQPNCVWLQHRHQLADSAGSIIALTVIADIIADGTCDTVQQLQYGAFDRAALDL